VHRRRDGDHGRGRASTSHQRFSRLINDPFADPLVEAVGLDLFTKQVRGELDTSDIDPQLVARVQSLIDEVAVRTKFFDEFFVRSAANGVRQAVILASGLDARAYRLRWPAKTGVYEIDQPAVIEFKTTALARLGATPTVERRTVAMDLRGEWPGALRAAGFDADAPTMWSAEGLLMYLPSEAQERLFDNITALSAAGSTTAADCLSGPRNLDDAAAHNISDGWREKGFTLDMPSLTFSNERGNLINYLTAQGWQVDCLSRTDLFAQNNVALSKDADDGMGELVYVSATR